MAKNVKWIIALIAIWPILAFGQTGKVKHIPSKIDSTLIKVDTLKYGINYHIQSNVDSLTGLANRSVNAINDSLSVISDSLQRGIQTIETHVQKLEEKSLERKRVIKNESFDQLGIDSEAVNSTIDDTNEWLNEFTIPQLSDLESITIDLPKPVSLSPIDVSKYQNQLKDLKAKTQLLDRANIEQASDWIDKQIESKLFTRKEIKELQQAQQNIDAAIKEKAELAKALQDKEKVKSEAKNTIKNHSNELIQKNASKVEQAQASMAKYKRKYDKVTSIKDLPKMQPNRMKGKPLVKRLQPGLTLQSYASQYAEFTVSPQLSFRWTGKLTVGAGVFQKVAFDKSDLSYKQIPKTTGYRLYSQLTVYKKMYLYGSIDKIYTEDISLKLKTTINQDYHFLLGVGKDYKISNSIRGFTIASMNLSELNSSYNIEKYHVRFGINYRINKIKNIKLI